MEITITISTAELHNIRIALDSRLNRIHYVLQEYEHDEGIQEWFKNQYNAIQSIFKKLDDQEDIF